MASRLVRAAAPLLRWSVLLAVAGANACGGTYVPGDGDGSGGAGDDGSGGADDDGSATGGVPASGGSPGSGGFLSIGGTPGTGGGSGGGGGECCLAEFQCDAPGDTEIDIQNGCPEGAECYARTVCCSVGYCMKEQAACDGIPVCEEGESEMSECPEGWHCTARARCGTVITCLLDDVCDPSVQPNRNYVASSESECAAIDYSCPEHTTSFTDECGCGCEQPSTCPRWLDCAPGGVHDPLCSSTECPYTQRGL